MPSLAAPCCSLGRGVAEVVAIHPARLAIGLYSLDHQREHTVKTPCLFSIVALLGAATSAVLASNPAVDQIRAQIRALRNEERAVVKNIEASYDSIVRRDRLAEHQLIALRRALKQQEEQYLAIASTPQEREQIRAQFESLRKALLGEIRMDANLIHQLRTQEHAQIRLVQALYRARIAELENMIRVASKTHTTNKTTVRRR